MSSPQTPKSETSQQLFWLLLIPAGLLLGFGIIILPWSFGWEGGCLNCDFEGIGYSALDNLGPLPAFNLAPGLITLGVLLLVILNSQAWKYTDGY
ncbi:MAG: hypothetical protein AAGA48_12555 [Myxococcota bacterium]